MCFSRTFKITVASNLCTAPKQKLSPRSILYVLIADTEICCIVEYLPFSHFISFLLLLSLFSFILSPVLSSPLQIHLLFCEATIATEEDGYSDDEDETPQC